MDTDDVTGNCSKVWIEPLQKQVSSILNKIPPIKAPSMDPDVTKFELRIAHLEKNQRLVESKIKTQNELLKDNSNLIHQWIIPTLELIFSETDSLKDRKEFTQHIQSLLKHAEKSFKIYEKLE